MIAGDSSAKRISALSMNLTLAIQDSKVVAFRFHQWHAPLRELVE